MNMLAYGNTREQCENLINLAKEQQVNKEYTRALENLFNAKMMAEDKNWHDLEFKILNNIGSIYSDIFDYNKAMDYYIKGYQIALRESNESEKLLFLNNIGVLCSAKKDYQKAHEYIKQAYIIAKQINDTLRMGRFATNLAVIAHKTDNIDLAEKYLNIGFNILKDNTSELEYLFIQIIKVENLFYKKEYDNAKKLALEVYKRKEEIEHTNAKAQFLLLLMQIYSQKKDFQNAIFVAEESLSLHPKLTTKMGIYEELAKIYQKENNIPLAFQYKDSVIIIKDSLNYLNEINQIANNQIQFDLLHLENKFIADKKRQRSERIFFVCVILFFFVLLLASVLIFRTLSINNKQQKIMAINKQRIAELELGREKNEKLLLEQQLNEKEALALLKQERLDNVRREKLLLKRKLKEQELSALLNEEKLSREIETKNRELAAKVLFQSNRNELIEEIINKLSSFLSNQWKDDALGTIIQQLKRQLKDSTEWEGFLTYFEQVNPEFLSSLKKKHPHLTADEIRFLSYIYLGLSSKEISMLLNITPAHYRKKKQRISFKLDVETAELYSYLLNEIL